MKPSFSQILLGSAGAIISEIGPQIRNNSYALGQASVIGLLMLFVAQEADRAADTLSLETVAMRALFADAADAPIPDDLRGRLRAMAEAPPAPNFTVTALQDLAASMKALLIELHAALEDSPDEWARALEAKVWDILRMGADNRQLYLPVL